VVSLRADAARNRRALLKAARELFSERGLDAPLDEIARQAGTGNATLYRHFPTRCELIAAVFAEALEEIGDACQRALAEPDPWTGFRRHVMFLCELQARDRGLAELLTARVTGAPALERLRERAYRDFVAMAERAKACGALRGDFSSEDLALLLMANAGLIERSATKAPEGWRRHVSFVLDGLHLSAEVEEAPPSPGLRAVRAAMADRAARFGCH
jgi:AcrR family transcriptional regulator